MPETTPALPYSEEVYQGNTYRYWTCACGKPRCLRVGVVRSCPNCGSKEVPWLMS